MSKISITGIQARNSAIKGLHYISEAVKSSLGPFGQNLLSEKDNKISNDGAFIAEQLTSTIENEFERRGAIVAQQNIAKINDELGDGSSTAWALHDEIIKEVLRYLPNEKSIKAKKTYSEVAEMLEKSKNEVVNELDKMAQPITSKEELIKSALVSVEDETIAELLGSTQWELGTEGIIIAEEVNDSQCSIEKVKGIRLDNGFGTSHVITNQEKQSLELDNMNVFMTNYTVDITEIKLLNDLIFKHLIFQKKLGIILIARAFTSEAITLCMESTKSGFAIFPVNAPYTDQTQMMHDIESVIGGRYIDIEENRLEDVYITDIGFAKRFVAKRFDAVITGVEDEHSIERTTKRAEELKKKLEGSQSDFEKKLLKTRIAQLTDGFAILKVGSKSLTDRKRLFDKAEDGVNAIRLALKHGTVAGAGQAFKEISDKMEETNILKRPLLCVYNQIISLAPEDWTIPEYVRDPVKLLQVILDKTCAFVPSFVSINAISTEENKPKCKCNQNE